MLERRCGYLHAGIVIVDTLAMDGGHTTLVIGEQPGSEAVVRQRGHLVCRGRVTAQENNSASTCEIMLARTRYIIQPHERPWQTTAACART